MAANFWTSLQSKQLLDAEDVSKVHPADQQAGLTAEDVKLLKIQGALNIKVLAQQAKLRQRVVATATVYLRRLYIKKSMVEYNPRLAGPACLYLASKAEECAVQAKVLVFYMKKRWPQLGYEVKHILQTELQLLEALDFCLVVFHPYRPMVKYLKDAGLSAELTKTCWSMINDCLATDICLMYAPHMIALACIYLACVVHDHDLRAWFEDLRVDLAGVQSITFAMLDYYDKYHCLPEDAISSAFARLPP